ncbi:MAG: hypothetical protein MK212_01135 [Saprospiraceae bacterium]|nr:hypothetical protein [Saprospiraceae bacterium]
MKSSVKLFSLAVLTLLLVSSCGSDKKPYIQFPADTIAKGLDKVQNFSIVLYDMNVDEEDKCFHKYKIIAQTGDAPSLNIDTSDSTAVAAAIADSAAVDPADLGFEESITDWKQVSSEDFDFYSSDMGMEIYSKVDGKLSKITAPPGYSQYVGNEKYGTWRTNSSGGSFWAFYGRYMFISSMFRLMSPVPYGYYSGYGAYRGSRPYYGPNGSAYGTGSKHASGMNNGYAKRSASNSKLKNRVNNSVSKSAKATGGKRTAATTQSKSSSRTSRSGSRYSSSSSRSRSSSSGGK